MTRSKIKTYDTKSFRRAYMQEGEEVAAMLKFDFSKFFIVRVEKMLRIIRLPVPPVRATTHTLIFLTGGEATMTIGSSIYRIHKNECLIVPAGQVYSFSHPDVNRGYLINFHDDMIIGKYGKKELLKDFAFLQVWGNPHIKLDSPAAKNVLHIMKRLLTEYSSHGLKNHDLIRAYFIALLCEIAGEYESVPSPATGHAIQLSNSFKELIFAHFRTRHLVTDYASMLHISPNHLNKSVKAATGKSPTTWIDEAIVLEAKVLLYQTDLSISAVAAETGISDPSYFSRLFKRYEGLTPMEFRRRIEKS